MGFADEIMGAIGTGYARMMEPELFADQTISDTYKEGRNMVRVADKAAIEANPKTSFLANLAGGVTTGLKIPLPAARGAKYAAGAGLGGLAGLGYSDAESTQRQVLDTALGGLMGLGGVYAGEKVGQGLTALKGSKAGQYAGEKINQGLAALGRESAQTVDDIAAPIVAQYPAQKAEIVQALTKGATPEEAAVIAKAAAFKVPLSRGDVTRTATQQGLEDFAQKGVYGVDAEAAANAFRQSQQAALRDASKNLIQTTSGAPMVENLADVGAAVSGRLQGMKKAGDEAVSSAYGAVKKLGEASIKPQNFSDDLAPIVQKLQDEFPLDTMPQTKAVLARAGELFPSGSKAAAPVSISKIDSFRKFANAAYGSTEIGNQADKAGVQMLKGQIQGTVDRALRDNLVYGNPETITALKSATKLAQEHFSRFRADDVIGEIADGGLTPEAVVQMTRGYGKIGGDKQAAELVNKMGELLGKDSNEFSLLKQSQLRQIFGKNLDSLLSGDLQKGFNANEVVKNLDELLTNNKSLANAYFSPDEQKVLKDFAEVAYRATNRVSGAVNYSNTTPALLRWGRSFANQFGFLGRLVGAPVEVVTGGMDAIKKSGEAQKAVSGFASEFTNPDNALALGLRDKLSNVGARLGVAAGAGAASYKAEPKKSAPIVVPEVRITPEEQEIGPQSSIESTIKNAANITGVDPALLQAVAKTESALNPDAQSKTSTASGLFQITAPTWKRLVSKYGAEHGIKASDINDPEANAIMASYLTRDNAEGLAKNLGREVTPEESYTAHFMGLSGATKLLKADDNENAAKLFPQAAKANKFIFFAKGKPLTVAELKSKLAAKIQTT
jgi:hypothetical protein